MRLHALTVEAFGPFVERQQVDFDTLACGGLFLVHGPTGAGKTSILDAVCFALFADVPGDRQARGLRSDLASPERPAVVCLDFTAAGRRLQITRQAEHHRPKKRGTGVVKVASSVVLRERVGCDWAVMSTRLDESAEVVHDVLGLGLGQFRRVALLPQGDFAAFLTASPEERRALLERLFDVSRFTDLEAWLAEQRRQLGQQVAVQEHVVAGAVGQLTELLATLPAAAVAAALAAGDSGDDQLPDLGSVSSERWGRLGDRVGAALDAWAIERMTACAATEAAEREAAERLESALDLAAKRRRGQHAASELQRLSRDDARIAGLRDRCEAASRAAGAAGEMRRLDAAATGAARATATLETAREALLAALGPGGWPPCRQRPDEGRQQRPTGSPHGPHGRADGSLPRLEQVRDGSEGTADLVELRAALDAGRTHLEVAERAVLATQQVARQRDRATDAMTSARQAHDESAAALQSWEAEVDAARTAATTLAALAAGLPERAHRVASLARLSCLHGELLAANEQQAVTDAELVSARERQLAAGEALLTLEKARVHELAAELATGLQPGRPCPVCGSCAHPAPRAHGAAWSPEQIALATDRLADCAAAVERRAVEQSAVQTLRAARSGDVAAALGELGLDRSALEHLPRELATARAAESEASQAVAGLRRAQATLAAADTEQARLVAGMTERDRALAAAQARAAEVAQHHTATAEQAARAVADHARDCPCSPSSGLDAAADVTSALRAAHDRHAQAEAAAAALEAAGHQLDAVTAAHQEASAAFAAALTDSGFAGRAELAAALLPADELTTCSRQISQHDQAVAIHTATMADPEVAAACAAPTHGARVPDNPDHDDANHDDPDRARATHESARLSHLALAREAAAAQRVATLAQGVLAQLTPAAAELETTRARHAEITQLADLVSGTGPGNLLRMRLSAFVLAARLERVVDLANERLARMGQGRFRLQHDDARAARGARSGLGLVVFDEWTGVPREPASLSGGESFMASLALALGLADAIHETSGGSQVQTLFVDEGFGSLDEESLDNVMAVLDGLRDGGRAVGVVSHLGDLRDRIPVRLQVRKSPRGSHVLLITPSRPAA